MNLILWALSGAIMLAVLYGPHDAQAYVHVATKGEAGFYNGWSRTAWSLSLGYIMLACCLGRGGELRIVHLELAADTELFIFVQLLPSLQMSLHHPQLPRILLRQILAI